MNQSFSSTVTEMQFGISEDVPVPGNYDRDGREDIAIWRPSASPWWIARSIDLYYTAIGFG